MSGPRQAPLGGSTATSAARTPPLRNTTHDNVEEEDSAAQSQPHPAERYGSAPPENAAPAGGTSRNGNEAGNTDDEVAPVDPAPVDPKTVFLAGLFIIAMLAVLYVGQPVILPMVLAIILKLLFQPVMRQADRLHIPRILSALVATAFLITALASLAAILSGSAGAWFSQLPQGMSRIEQKLSFLQAPAELLKQLDGTIDRVLSGSTSAETPATPPSGRLSLPAAFLSGTGTILDLSLSSFLLLFFLLAAGDTFLRRLVEVLPRFRDKRQAVDITMQIERDIGTYLLTVTAMNLGVGLAMTLGTYLCGLNDPILWGVIVFVLNYVPILGPIAGFALFGLVGFLSFDNLGTACLPAVIYIGVHIAEGEVLTPLLLAKRLTLNPALIVMSLIIWYWLWGVAGAFLAVPLLAITKIVCERFRPLMAFGHFLGD